MDLLTRPEFRQPQQDAKGVDHGFLGSGSSEQEGCDVS